MKQKIFGVSEEIKRRVYYYKRKYNLSLADAFDEAVRKSNPPKDSELYWAWWTGDYRKFIPGEYIEAALDFDKHPLKYAEMMKGE